MPSYYSLKNTTKVEDVIIANMMESSTIDDTLKVQLYKLMQRLDDVVTEYFNTSLVTQKQIDDLVAERDRLNIALEDLERTVQSYQDFPV